MNIEIFSNSTSLPLQAAKLASFDKAYGEAQAALAKRYSQLRMCYAYPPNYRVNIRIPAVACSREDAERMVANYVDRLMEHLNRADPSRAGVLWASYFELPRGRSANWKFRVIMAVENTRKASKISGWAHAVGRLRLPQGFHAAATSIRVGDKDFELFVASDASTHIPIADYLALECGSYMPSPRARLH